MKMIKMLAVLIVPGLLMMSCTKEESMTAAPGSGEQVKTILKTGNDAPNGVHYNLNIIGVPKGKKADMTLSEGHRIFVRLDGNTTINLSPGTEFLVTDANGTDGKASFRLPENVATTYTVWARALGKPTGGMDIKTCAQLLLMDGTYDEICAPVPLSLIREKGSSKFIDVTQNLLFLYVPNDVLGTDGVTVLPAGTYPLFDPALENYYWSYDNKGLKLLQLRFYPVVAP